MTYVGLFEEVDLQDKIKKLKKELRKIKADKTRGQNDLERIIEEQLKEIDTLKAVIDLKDVEITTLTNNLNKIKENHNKKIIDKWEEDIANNTPHKDQFE